MPWHNQPFNYYGTSPTQVMDDLDKANENFQQLAQAFVNNDPTQLTVKNADQVDGYHASQTPTANTVPVANSEGKLALRWLPYFSQTNFSRYFVNSMPSNPLAGDLVYNISNKTLMQFDGSNWYNVPWRDLVRRSVEWFAGAIRINSITGALETTPSINSGIWYECIPLVGATIFDLHTKDNTNYSIKCFLPQGCGVILDSVNHIPIVITLGVTYKFHLILMDVAGYGRLVRLRMGNIQTTCEVCSGRITHGESIEYAITERRVTDGIAICDPLINGHANTTLVIKGTNVTSTFNNIEWQPTVKTVWFSGSARTAISSSQWWLGTVWASNGDVNQHFQHTISCVVFRFR